MIFLAHHGCCVLAILKQSYVFYVILRLGKYDIVSIEIIHLKTVLFEKNVLNEVNENEQERKAHENSQF